MMDKESGDDSLQPKDKPLTGVEPKQEKPESPMAGPEGSTPSAPIAIEKPKAGAVEQRVDADGSPSSSGDHEPRTDEANPSVAARSVCAKKPQGFFGERPLPAIEMASRVLRYR